jgi:asparagine N-glycosylation enzyme membrane subunit Stt3
MMTLDEDIEELAKRMLPGAIAIALLFFLMHPSGFIDWFFNKAVLYVILFFFYKPVAKIIIERKLDPGDKKLVVIGLMLFIPYVLLMGLTLWEIGITLLQLIVILSFFWAVLGFVKEKIV